MNKTQMSDTKAGLQGVINGLLMSLAVLVAKPSQPEVTVLGRLPGTRVFHRLESNPDSETYPGLATRMLQRALERRLDKTNFDDRAAIGTYKFVQERVSNYTYQDAVCRVWTMVGVSYESDLDRVRAVLEHVCNQTPGFSDHHPPEVLLTDFGSSAVNYKVCIWVENPWDHGPVKSNLNEAIWKALKDAKIVIAFPQLDVHLDRAA